MNGKHITGRFGSGTPEAYPLVERIASQTGAILQPGS